MKVFYYKVYQMGTEFTTKETGFIAAASRTMALRALALENPDASAIIITGEDAL